MRSTKGSHLPLEDRQARLSGAECGNIDACVKILDGEMVHLSLSLLHQLKNTLTGVFLLIGTNKMGVDRNEKSAEIPRFFLVYFQMQPVIAA